MAGNREDDLADVRASHVPRIDFRVGHPDGQSRAACLYYVFCACTGVHHVIRLPAEVEERLAALAKATGRTKTFHARQATLEYRGDPEDPHLAGQCLIDIRAGPPGPCRLKR